MPSAPIAASSSGDNTIVAAVAGKRIRVHGYVIVATGAVAVKWRSGTTDLSGAMALAANGGVSAPLADPLGDHEGWFDTTAGAALNLNLGAAVAVNGHVVYSAE